MFVEFNQTWEGANTLCGSASSGKATLVSIQSQDENDHVESLFNYKDGLIAWLGGYLTSTGSYAWLDGSTFEYSNWATGEPIGETPQSIMMYGRSGSQPGKWSAEPPAAGISGSVCAHIP